MFYVRFYLRLREESLQLASETLARLRKWFKWKRQRYIEVHVGDPATKVQGGGMHSRKPMMSRWTGLSEFVLWPIGSSWKVPTIGIGHRRWTERYEMIGNTRPR